jgi:hypothetical protein
MDSAPPTNGQESAPGAGGAGSGDSSSDSADSTTAPQRSAPGVAPDSSSEAPSSGGVVDLGDAGTAGDLAERAADALADTDTQENADGQAPPADRGESSSSGPLTASEACSDPLASPGEDADTLVLQGRATLAGRPVDVWVHDYGTSRRMVAVATDGSCAVVADGPVPG